MADVEPVASVVSGYRVQRDTAEGPRFVHRPHPEPGVVDWTEDREAALLFADRGQAGLVQQQIVVLKACCAAVVPAGD